MAGGNRGAELTRTFKKQRRGGVVRALKCLGVVALLAVLTLVTVPAVAEAAVTTEQLENHVVQGVSPRGTTINLFDYWLTSQDDSDASDPSDADDAGINNGHSLKFRRSGGSVSNGNAGLINGYSGSNAPTQGLVEATLGTDGYPVLSGSAGGTEGESLNYLFNEDATVDGKAIYSNVDGLLQVDEDGYYYYDCRQNFASFEDGDGSSFVLYDTAAVSGGEFFPFDSGTAVFDSTWNDQLEDSGIDKYSMNHYFGVSMSTRFIQSDGGLIDGDENRPVTYNFSGDDDVWVYIDGVLVGDLGGIHGATSLEINFATGAVYVYHDENGNNQYDSGEQLYGDGATTIKACFEAAGEDTDNGFDDDTFSDGSYHTLNFFYLERGNSDSNMSLKYNLETIPESGVLKVDQDDNALGSVSFELTAADQNYTPLENAQTISGETDWSTGELIFSYTDAASGQERPYTLDELGQISRYWILEETSTREGYRSAGEIHLYFSEQGESGNGTGVLLVDNQWETGAYAQTQLTVTAPDTAIGADGKSYSINDGTVFAVVMQKGAENSWYPVTGSAADGWNVFDANDDEAIVKAAQESNYPFAVGSGGAYQVEIDELPGDITTYENYIEAYGLSGIDDAEYAVKYYWTDAESLDEFSTGNQCVELEVSDDDSSSFDHVFSVMLNVPNIKNELTLKKTDTDGKALPDAVYTLYSDVNGNGSYDKESDTLVKANLKTGADGTVAITSGDGILAAGKYVLVETEAPSGYLLDTTPIQIIVDDEGVHVNAGDVDDNISVETDLGTLVATMKGFAAGNGVDATLYDIQVQPQSSEAYPTTGEEDWTDVESVGAAHLYYTEEGYVLIDESSGEADDADSVDEDSETDSTENDADASTSTLSLPYVAASGWSRLNVTQCTESDAKADASLKTNLGSESLNALFTGDVTIHVTDKTTGNLDVSKTVVGGETADDTTDGGAEGGTDSSAETFSITVTFKDSTGIALTNEDAPNLKYAILDSGESANDLTDDDYEDVTLQIDGSCTVELENGQTAHFVGIPEGVTYQVTETNAGEYTPSYSDEGKGTIKANETSTVKVTNYKATGSLKLTGLTKTLVGRDWIEGDSFTFTLSGKNVTAGVEDQSEGFELPEEYEVTVNYDDAVTAAQAAGSESTEDVAVPFGFDEITFSQEGTYEFTVTESQNDLPAGVQITNGLVTYRVEVVDENHDGNLSAKATLVSQEGPNYFVNTYTPSVATASLAATKLLNGVSSGIQSGLFTFQVENTKVPADAAEAPMPSNVDANGMVTNGTDGAINFGTLTFDTEGTYIYTVSEVNNRQTGVTYDNTLYTVVYEVSDDPALGTLVATQTIYQGDQQTEDNKVDTITFSNSYQPTPVTVPGDATSAGFSGTKTVTVESGDFTLEADQFTFTMTIVSAPDGVEVPTPSLGASVTNNADGSFNFGTLTFMEPGTYVYTVSEVANSLNGVSYDGNVYTLTFVVEDVDGALEVTSQSITDKNGTEVTAAGLDFTNIYNDGQTAYTIGGTKVLDTDGYDGATLEDGQYTFVLVDADGNEVGWTTNAANGSFAFDPMTYTEAGTYTYTVYELGVDGQLGTGGTDGSNVTYSTESYTVTVTVTASNDGRGLSATADVQNSEVVFTNTYAPTPVVVGPSGTAQIAGTKVLDVADGSDRALDEGEFTFELIDAEGNQVATATNAADGSFVFDDLTFDEAGTYSYTVAEVNDGKGGVTYDTTAYGVTVTVTEDTDAHALVAEVAYTTDGAPADSITFTNSYEAASTTATLGVSKELQGGTLEDGQFTFKLTGSKGAPMPENTTATNTAAGEVSFGTVTFDEVGEYDYTITEVDDEQDGITYDEDAERTIHVSVTDDGEGHLVAELAYGSAGSHYVNIDTTGGDEPDDEIPDDETPETPDDGTSEMPDETTPDEGTDTTTDVSANAEVEVTVENGESASDDDALAGTGDSAFAATVVAALVGVGALAAGTIIQRRKRQ